MWALILYIGIGLYHGVVDQGVLGYPNKSQLLVLIIVPAAMVGVNIAVAAGSKKVAPPILIASLVLQIPIGFLILMAAGGGI